MANKKIWSGILPLSILASFIVGILILGQFARNRDKDIIENGIETIGTTIDEGSQRMIQLEYQVDGRDYIEGVGKPHTFMYKGEQFQMMYSQTDPETIVVFFDKPHFTDKFEYDTASCLSITKSLSVVDYRYDVLGQHYRRQTLFRDHSLDSDDYFVLYRIDQPEIGYLIETEDLNGL